MEIEQTAGGKLYVLASNGLYAYNPTDQSITFYDRLTGLSDTYITHIAWSDAAKALIITYNNQNIDILDYKDRVTNIPNLKNSNIASDKTINAITVDKSTAYVATAFGITVINLTNAIIENTYNLTFNVHHTYIKDGYIYASSIQNGLYRGAVNDNLNDKANWKRVGDYEPYTKTMNPQLLATVEKLNPDGPRSNNYWWMSYQFDSLWTAVGGWGHGVSNSRKGEIQIMTDGDWHFPQNQSISEQTGIPYLDINNACPDPLDHKRILAASRTGLYEFYDGKFVKLYNDSNSPIEANDGKNKAYELVSGGVFDTKGNYWCLVSQAPTHSLLELKSTGEWVAHDNQAFMTLNGKSAGSLEHPFFDSRGLLWFCNNHWIKPALYSYDPSTGNVNSYTEFVNQDGSAPTIWFVTYAAEDAEHNIWIGTNEGPMYLPAESIASGDKTFIQVKVPRNDGTDNADYLLSGVNISSIIVDKAGRKWFGSGSDGVYCISADNISQVYHFKAENSPLLSNSILSMAMNDDTGELFIGTDKGLCSYMTGANEAAEGMTENSVRAYPNPVTPDYTGPITITGLTENADVKITNLNGILVEEGKSSNGVYKWYGMDRTYQRVGSGIYLVHVVTAEGDNGVVCKIAVVN